MIFVVVSGAIVSIDFFQSTLSTVETNDKNSNMFAICKVETLSDRSSKIPTTREHSIDPFRFIINFLIISLSQVNWYFFPPPKRTRERSYIVECSPLPIPRSAQLLCMENQFDFICFSDVEYQCFCPKSHAHIVRSSSESEDEKQKKVNFIELPVIYLIFVFIMFHLLSNSFGRGLANSKCGAWTFNIIVHCSL